MSLDLSGFFALYDPVEPDQRSEPNRRQGDLCIQPCMGGTAQTKHMIVHPRHIKTRALYVYGSHQVNVDDTTHTLTTDAMWEVYVKASTSFTQRLLGIVVELMMDVTIDVRDGIISWLRQRL